MIALSNLCINCSVCTMQRAANLEQDEVIRPVKNIRRQVQFTAHTITL